MAKAASPGPGKKTAKSGKTKKPGAIKKIRVKKAKAVAFKSRGIRRKSAPRLSLRKPGLVVGELVPVTRTFTTLVRDSEVLKAGQALAAFYSELDRRLYARAAFLLRTTGKLPGFDDLKNAFSAEHGLSSRQFNAIATRVAGLVQNAVANLEYRRGQVTERIEQTEKTIARLEADPARRPAAGAPALKAAADHQEAEAGSGPQEAASRPAEERAGRDRARAEAAAGAGLLRRPQACQTAPSPR